MASTTTTTDAAGKYNFSSLAYGLHDLTFSKSGYGSYKLFGYKLFSVSGTSSANGTIIPTVQMGKLATTSITSLSVSGNSYNNSPGVSVLRLYGESLQSNVYTDPNVGKRTFPNLNTTTVPAVSFVIP